MQPYQPPISHFYTDSPALKSRVYVQLFAWFGLLIAFLALLQGRSLGLIHVPLFALGIYASWDDVVSRRSHLALFAAGCVVWSVFDAAYLLALIASTNSATRAALVGIVATNTFPNIGPALGQLLVALAEDAHVLVFFSAVTACFFDAMAAYWACALHRDIVAIVASTSHHGLLGGSQQPLQQPAADAGLQQHQQRQQPGAPLSRPQHNSAERAATIGSFGTFARAAQPAQATPRALHPFTGRGFRLGADESAP